MSLTVSEESLQRLRRFVEKYCEKSGTSTHPDKDVTEAVVRGLAHHMDTLGKPLCPCRFYPDKKEEAKHRTWICACDDMQIYKYCHCLLFLPASHKLQNLLSSLHTESRRCLQYPLLHLPYIFSDVQ